MWGTFTLIDFEELFECQLIKEADAKTVSLFFV